MTAAEILAALARHHGLHALDRPNRVNAEPWALLPEVPIASLDHLWQGQRRVDALAVRLHGSQHGYERVAYEIKVSRGDIARESEWKYGPVLAIAHRFVYATPAGLLRPEEIPACAGLLEVLPSGRVRYRVRAPRREVGPCPEWLVAVLARRASRAEERLRRATAAEGVA